MASSKHKELHFPHNIMAELAKNRSLWIKKELEHGKNTLSAIKHRRVASRLDHNTLL